MYIIISYQIGQYTFFSYCYQQKPPYRRSADFAEESNGMDMQPQPPLRSSNPLPGTQRSGPGNLFNRLPMSANPADTFPPADSRPRPAPRPPRMQPAPPKPQQRQTPSPPANRPNSGSNRDNLLSPPSSDQANKIESSGRPPGKYYGHSCCIISVIHEN